MGHKISMEFNDGSLSVIDTGDLFDNNIYSGKTLLNVTFRFDFRNMENGIWIHICGYDKNREQDIVEFSSAVIPYFELNTIQLLDKQEEDRLVKLSINSKVCLSRKGDSLINVVALQNKIDECGEWIDKDSPQMTLIEQILGNLCRNYEYGSDEFQKQKKEFCKQINLQEKDADEILRKKYVKE